MRKLGKCSTKKAFQRITTCFFDFLWLFWIKIFNQFLNGSKAYAKQISLAQVTSSYIVLISHTTQISSITVALNYVSFPNSVDLFSPGIGIIDPRMISVMSVRASGDFTKL